MATRLCFTKYRANFLSNIQSPVLGDDFLRQISLQAHCKSGRSILKKLHLAANDLNLKASSLHNSSSPSLCLTSLPTTSDPFPFDQAHTLDDHVDVAGISLKRDAVGLPLQDPVEDCH